MSRPAPDFGPILDHPQPTDEELYNLLLVGLWYAHPTQQKQKITPTSLGRMANGVFTALERVGVMTAAYRDTLATRNSLVMLVDRYCTTVRTDDSLSVVKIRELASRQATDLFHVLGTTELYGHSLLVAPRGYRLFLSTVGYAKAHALTLCYPNLTQEAFDFGWSDYKRRVRQSDLSHSGRRRVPGESAEPSE